MLIEDPRKERVNLLDPEMVKKAIARQNTYCEGRKANAVDVYTNFLRMLNLRWEPPSYSGSANRKAAGGFIPHL
ncbi:hypothetical protein KEJ49_05020 [Candidatus Bathyarchaeota archaeon]|nr:hypothetical protein [Candidatus Bathyarchaeota archaeon]